jgi:glucose/arabinose dehydrogenase
MNLIKRALTSISITVFASLLVVQNSNAQVGVSAPPPPSEPIILGTAEIPQIRIVPIATGLHHPWGMAFRDNGDILITERDNGTLRVVRNGELLPQDIPGVPEIYSNSDRAGLMDVALHPEDDSVVYLTYTKSFEFEGETEQTVSLARGRLVENQLVGVEEIFTAKGLDRGIAASRMMFMPDGKLLMSMGGSYVFLGTGDYAQDPMVHFGKVLRLNPDGSVPDDNPFVGDDAYLPEIYSMGHRNQLGMAIHPETGEIWATENGPQGGDEANIIRPGANYGWPLASYSRQYRGDKVSETPWLAEFEDAEVVWWPSIAPSGTIFYTGERFPQWQGNLFVGSMMEGRLPQTGHLQRIVFNSRGQEIRRESLLRELKQRVREVQEGPDGYIYLLTEEENGALLRIEPVE